MNFALSHLMPLEAYRQPREHLFPSEQALRWFVRQHRERLIDAQALLKLRGRALVHDENFDAYVLRAAQTAAHAQSSAVAEAHPLGASTQPQFASSDAA